MPDVGTVPGEEDREGSTNLPTIRFDIIRDEKGGRISYRCASTTTAHIQEVIDVLDNHLLEVEGDAKEKSRTAELPLTLVRLRLFQASFDQQTQTTMTAVHWESLAAASQSIDAWCTPLIEAQEDMIKQCRRAKESVKACLSADKSLWKARVPKSEVYITRMWNSVIKATHDWFLEKDKAAKELNQSFMERNGFEISMLESCSFDDADRDCTRKLGHTLRTYIASRRGMQAARDQKLLLRRRLSLEQLYVLPGNRVESMTAATTSESSERELEKTRKQWQSRLDKAESVIDKVAAALQMHPSLMKERERPQAWLGLADHCDSWSEFAEKGKLMFERKTPACLSESEGFKALSGGQAATEDNSWTVSTLTKEDDSTTSVAGKNHRSNQMKRLKKKMRGKQSEGQTEVDLPINADKQDITLIGVGLGKSLDEVAEENSFDPSSDSPEGKTAPITEERIDHETALQLVPPTDLENHRGALGLQLVQVSSDSATRPAPVSDVSHLSHEAQGEVRPTGTTAEPKAGTEVGSRGSNKPQRPPLSWAQVAASARPADSDTPGWLKLQL